MTKLPTTRPATTHKRKLSPKAKEAASPVLAAAPRGYADWLADVKARIHAAQQRAGLAVNRELLAPYCRLGRDILERQQRHGWGAGIVEKLSTDLRAAFPAMKGFSRANLIYMRAFAEAWPEDDLSNSLLDNCPGATTSCS